MSERLYCGRFAPTPNGPLHFGSLITALGGFLDARAAGGKWLLRIEDLDPPRTQAGAAEDIMRTLEIFGLYWDDAVWFQSHRDDAYRDALDRLQAQGLLYPCACSRKDIQQALGNRRSRVYPGTCRDGLPAGRTARSLRLRVPEVSIEFDDRLQGCVSADLASSVGDFLVRRADGLFAYHLATVVDDAAQGITDVVRGADLLDSTARQIHLQRILDNPTPRYLHLPVAAHPSGEKLSKQTHARAVAGETPSRALYRALQFLGQPVAEVSEQDAVADLLAFGISNWDAARIPRRRTIQV